MRDAQNEKDRLGQCDRSTTHGWKILTVGLMLLFAVPGTPIQAKATVGGILCKIISFGTLCKPFGASDPPALTVPVNCSKPVMTGAPRFLTTPKGAAKYRFPATCTSPVRSGIMEVTWEGSWTPSETRADRPNASETLTITGYEMFIPGREPGGKIFMYWTARCTADPWLQGGTCHRYGGYVPDDLRDAFPEIDSQSFPRTAKSISPTLRQRLVKDYQDAQRAIERASMSTINRHGLQAMKIRPQQSETMTSQRRQAQAMTVQPQPTPSRLGIVEQPRTNLSLFSRGTDAPEQGQSESQDKQDSSTETPSSSVASEGEAMDNEPAFPQVAITFDRPLHFISAKGEDTLITTGVYEIEPLMDLQLSLAREGQATVLLPANSGTHNEAIPRTMGLIIPGSSNDEQHLVFLTPDGKRFDVLGSTSGVKSRGTRIVATLPDTILKDAIIQASAQTASEPLPPCQRNPVPTGPRWLPVPCTMPSITELPPIPVP